MILNAFVSSYFLIRYINPKCAVQMLLLRLIRTKDNRKKKKKVSLLTNSVWTFTQGRLRTQEI